MLQDKLGLPVVDKIRQSERICMDNVSPKEVADDELLFSRISSFLFSFSDGLYLIRLIQNVLLS